MRNKVCIVLYAIVFVMFVLPAFVNAAPLPAFTGVLAILENIGNWIFVIGLLIAVVMVILGAYMFIDPFSGGAGNPAQVEKGRSIFLWAAVGLAVILLAKGTFTILRSIFGV